jgi:hypothetical protein
MMHDNRTLKNMQFSGINVEFEITWELAQYRPSQCINVANTTQYFISC